MEMRLLRLVHSYIVAHTTELGAGRLEQILELLELTWDLQSEPAEKASEVLTRLRALDDAWLNQVEQELKADSTLGHERLLLLSYLATLKWLLQDESYSIILDAYPDSRGRCGESRSGSIVPSAKRSHVEAVGLRSQPVVAGVTAMTHLELADDRSICRPCDYERSPAS